MKTLAEIQRIRKDLGDKFVTECPKYSGYPEHILTFNAGFDACLALMLEREKVAVEALEFYAGDDKSDIDMDIFDKIKINTKDKDHPYVDFVDTEWLCKPAREALEKLK